MNSITLSAGIVADLNPSLKLREKALKDIPKVLLRMSKEMWEGAQREDTTRETYCIVRMSSSIQRLLKHATEMASEMNRDEEDKKEEEEGTGFP